MKLTRLLLSILLLWNMPIVAGWKENKLMETSVRGIYLIKGFEEFRERPYQDLDGGMLIGYGHQILPPEQHLTSVTRENAELLLQQDILKAERCLGHLIDFDLTQNQFDALVSFIYSTGCARFQCSSVYVYLKRKDFKNALLQWKRWIYTAQGMPVMGLAKKAKEGNNSV